MLEPCLLILILSLKFGRLHSGKVHWLCRSGLSSYQLRLNIERHNSSFFRLGLWMERNDHSLFNVLSWLTIKIKLTDSVWRDQCDQMRQNIFTLEFFKSFDNFGGFLLYLGNFWTYLVFILRYYANFYCYKWPKLIEPSGHTGRAYIWMNSRFRASSNHYTVGILVE